MIVGTIQSGNVQIYTANSARWTVDTIGHLYPASTSYQLGTTSNKVGDVLIEKDSYITWYSSSTAKGYIFVNSSDAMYINTNGNHPFDLQTNGTTRIKVEGDGRIGLNSSPASSVTLDVHAYTGTSAVTQLNSTSTSAFIPAYLDFYKNDNTNSVQWLGVQQYYGKDSAGNKHNFGAFIGMASDSTNGSEDGKFSWYLSEAGAGASEKMYLTSAGDLYAYSYTDISDARLKNVLGDAPSYWGTLKGFRLRLYQMKSQVKKTPERIHLGLIAQEAFGVAPQVVDTNDPKQWGVKSSYLRYMILGVVQEGQLRIETVEKKVESNEERITRLEKRVDELETEVAYLKAS